MAFDFDWTKLPASNFDVRFKTKINETILNALGKRDGPVSLVLQAKKVDLGSEQPTLKLLKVYELDDDKFNISFAMQYSGDARVFTRIIFPLIMHKKKFFLICVRVCVYACMRVHVCLCLYLYACICF